MKVRVRTGYVLHLKGGKAAKAGEVVDAKPEDIADQSWKVEEVGKRNRAKDLKEPPENRAMATAETRGATTEQ
ncbi:MAG: hypothetical protein JXA50_01770 [Deltaproteobacteria bacterium]|nr:hypothetical protein [Deltaproteobacteria bacterium]